MALLYSTNFIYNPEAGAAIGADRPFTAGGFIVVSERGNKLSDGGIKQVVVGEEYMRVLDILTRRYPDIKFIPWHDAPELFTNEVNIAEKSNIPVELGKEMPCYDIHERKFGGVSGQQNEIPIPAPKDSEKSSSSSDIW